MLITYCFVWPIIKTLVNGACSPINLGNLSKTSAENARNSAKFGFRGFFVKSRDQFSKR